MVQPPFPQVILHQASTNPIKSVRSIKRKVKFKMSHYKTDFCKNKAKTQSHTKSKYLYLFQKYNRPLQIQIITGRTLAETRVHYPDLIVQVGFRVKQLSQVIR